MLTYQDVLSRIDNDDSRNYLLLGNGFSMSYNVERFSFTSLLESAIDNGLIEEDSPMHLVFKEFETKDFEEVVKLLETSVAVVKKYLEDNEDCIDEERILTDAQLLKEHLVTIITNNHPGTINEIPDTEFINSTNFIKGFERVYSLNYDLLLYWTTIKLMDFKSSEMIDNVVLKPTDGFREDEEIGQDYVVFGNDGTKSNVLYLHGALHIFDKKNKIIKNTYSRTDVPLRVQTLQYLEDDIYPIFVSEGTSEQKHAKIIHNAYLNHCYKSLNGIGRKTKEDNLIVFGTMLKTNDTHIRKAVLNSGLKNIYFGISREEEKDQIADFVQELNNAHVPKEVFFYDYRTATVWR
ncbi:DUF4917 family protein [Sulfurovum sp. TSL1]|uniref:DUF4917 family protein n=1 Tax=Sulfurovum sp. TSL1 TaxID=2826994 RepID=UPI001CC46B0E|nr:DUF4917 family protein [Sulfurovum sp. TSL1]GIT98806.1 DUF4917 domain-containing protein [Sulfurovum sp. TSL1]